MNAGKKNVKILRKTYFNMAVTNEIFKEFYELEENKGKSTFS
jgi:hypothetical protein